MKLTAPDQNSAGLYFDHWEDENRVNVSSANPYSFLARADMTLTAVFTQEAEVREPSVSLYFTQSMNSDKTKKAVCLTTDRSAPDGWTVTGYGIYYGTNKSLGHGDTPDWNIYAESPAIIEDEFKAAYLGDSNKFKLKSSKSSTDCKGTYFFNLVVGDSTNMFIYGRAYADFKAPNGTTQRVWSSITANNYDSLLTE